MNSHHNVAQPLSAVTPAITPAAAAAAASAASAAAAATLAAHPIGTSYHHNDLNKYPASSSTLLSLLLNSTMPHATNTTTTTPTTLTPPAQPNSNPHKDLIQQQKQQHQQQLQYQEKQRAYVNALVDVTVQAIASIWPNATSTPAATSNNRPIANLNTFLHHILKHSRTTHSTLQLAIFYLFRIRPRVLERRNDDVYISCGRRMFLAALICAHKFLQDKTYKNSAWSKVSGLSVPEINHAERVMLQLLDWSLYVKKDTYDQWILMLQNHLKFRVPTPVTHSSTSSSSSTHVADEQHMEWQKRKIPPPTTTTTTITANASSSSSSSSATTLFKLGMPTPVEEVGHIKHALPCRVSLLSSPPERKRKASDACLVSQLATKRRLA